MTPVRLRPWVMATFGDGDTTQRAPTAKPAGEVPRQPNPRRPRPNPARMVCAMRGGLVVDTADQHRG